MADLRSKIDELRELRARRGAELTSDDGEVDWVVVERVLGGEAITTPMTRAEWDVVAGWLISIRLEYHGVNGSGGNNSGGASLARDSPYRAAVSHIATVLGESESGTYEILKNWWDAYRRRERYDEKKRREESER